MSEDIESRLRAALRPVEPSEEFSRTLLMRVTADRSSQSNGRSHVRRRFKAPARWFTASVAASLLVAVGIQHHLQGEHERESGLEARRQVIEALRVTSQKLDLAYEAVKSQSTSLADDQTGA
jgi:hypothetical protein